MPAIAETLDITNREASRVVVFSDRQEALAACVKRMVSAGFDVTATGFADDALEYLRQRKPPLTVVDLSLPAATGLEVLKAVRQEKLEIAVIVVSHDGSIRRAVEAMKLGAFDYLPEPFDDDRLILAMFAAISWKLPVPSGKWTADAIEVFEGFLELSPQMRELYRAIEMAGPAEGNVLISGTAGIGRDVCARTIHASSPRRHQPFVTLNCAAIPENLLASELFGHVTDAFPGAVADRAGLATEAHGGTLFLEEICALDAAMQARVLQLATHGTFQRLGSGRLEQVDVRIISATSLRLETAVTDGWPSEALFKRISAIEIGLPPVARRGDEIMRIAKLFLFAQAPGVGNPAETPLPEAVGHVRAPGRPGDVQDLQNTLQTAIATNNDRLDEAAIAQQEIEAPPDETPAFAAGAPGVNESGPQKRSGQNG